MDVWEVPFGPISAGIQVCRALIYAVPLLRAYVYIFKLYISARKIVFFKKLRIFFNEQKIY